VDDGRGGITPVPVFMVIGRPGGPRVLMVLKVPMVLSHLAAHFPKFRASPFGHLRFPCHASRFPVFTLFFRPAGFMTDGRLYYPILFTNQRPFYDLTGLSPVRMGST